MGSASCSVEEPCSNHSARPCNVDSATVYESNVNVFDIYEIGGLLGSGAFGQVRACWPLGSRDDTLHAVKIIDTKSASTHLSAYEEGELLHSLTHPHIVELYEIYHHDDMLFLIQERITGGELFAGIADRKIKVTERIIALVGEQLLQALQYLHDRRIVHRDVKAENILLESSPSDTQDWHVKLIDFGLAIRLEQGPFLFGSCNTPTMARSQKIICGTLYYCAPEIFTNYYGPKVDVWATGVMIYLALFGKYPFYDHDPTVAEAMICDQHAEPQWKPACAREHPQYQVSEVACDCLGALLEKDHAERLTSKDALRDPWFHNIRRLLHIESVSDKYEAAGMPIKRIHEGNQEIPMGVRLKASRAAARAPVSRVKEQSRTAALLAVKSRTRLAESARRSEVRALLPKNSVVGQSTKIHHASSENCEDAVDVDWSMADGSMAFWTRVQAVTATALQELDAGVKAA